MTNYLDRLSQLMLDEFKRVHERLDDFEERVNVRFDGIDGRLAHIEAELITINHRLETLEGDVGNLKGFAKEIDDLRDRVREIAKHLGLHKKIAA